MVGIGLAAAAGPAVAQPAGQSGSSDSTGPGPAVKGAPRCARTCG
jgi:hypothetical protein